MSNKKIGICIMFSAVIITIAGILLCAWWYPFESLLVTRPLSELPTPEESRNFYIRLAFFWASSVPCFVIMVFIGMVAARICRGEIFSFKIYKYLKISATIMFVDCVVFFAGNTVLYFMNLNPMLVVYLVMGLVGVAFGLCAAALASMAKNAAILKEDNDSIL